MTSVTVRNGLSRKSNRCLSPQAISIRKDTWSKPCWSLKWNGLVAMACAWVALTTGSVSAAANVGNRLAYLDDFCELYYPSSAFPKLITPQWIGEEGVDAVVILSIDDMRHHGPYERYLRPILDRLKAIDGRAPVSIMCNDAEADAGHLQEWLKEGVSLETHTADHPCPILAGHDFTKAKRTYDQCVDHMFSIPNNVPVAFRTPCMDGINSSSPRLFAEIIMKRTAAGRFLQMSSSVGQLFTPGDPDLPRELVQAKDGTPRFSRYVPKGYVNYIENYPYPYVIGKSIWEVPFTIPDDYEGHMARGSGHPATLEDMKAALEAAVAKKGVYVLTFHPGSWIENEQVIELIDHAVKQFGSRVKFLTFREMQERINENLLNGHPLRGEDGQDNGVRVLDLNADGYLDVVIGNEQLRQTRSWVPDREEWDVSGFPVAIAGRAGAQSYDAGVRFAVLQPNAYASFYVGNDDVSGVWHFDGRAWLEAPDMLMGLEDGGVALATQIDGIDQGVRFRDLDRDGRSELIVSNPKLNRVFRWDPDEHSWQAQDYSLPQGITIVDSGGQDHGVRFIDISGDGYDDLIFSNQERYAFRLFVPEAFLGFGQGWSRRVLEGERGDLPEIPMIVRGGLHPNNGAWFRAGEMVVQNEDTAGLPDLVIRVPFEDLLNGFQTPARSPEESLACIEVRPEFTVELVVHEPLVQDPVAFDWDAAGRLWVVEMGDYPSGVDGGGEAGGVIKVLEDLNGDGQYDRGTVFLDGLGFPTGLFPWGKGVFISAAPNIWYAEDTDGDGRADRKEILFSGFNEGNQQHRVNGFTYGLDNWIYGANGDSGGNIRSARTGTTTAIGGRDFRFHPVTGEFQAVSGQTQFGRVRDDWGNWFGNANPVWAWHYYLPERYLVRNPHLAVRSTLRHTADYPGAGRAFPVGRTQQRFNDIGAVGHVTSACSVTPYRDSLFGPEYTNSIFICEPAQNLVHREVLEPKGVSFSSRRAEGEADREFLASTDTWFRPVQMKTGPDGALYIADMYRQIIEHPEWIPRDVTARVDVRAGEDMGRIYRVYPKGASLRPVPRLAELRAQELVLGLGSSNGWERDTAQRLLVERKDAGVSNLLDALVIEHPDPRARIHALYTSDGLGTLTVASVRRALMDDHANVREHAVRLSERFLREWQSPKDANPGELRALTEELIALIDDPAIRVRQQLAFSLGEWNAPEGARALGKLVVREADQESIVTAVLSSAMAEPEVLLETVLEQGIVRSEIEPVINHLIAVIIDRGESQKAIDLLARRVPENSEAIPLWQIRALASLLSVSDKRVAETRAQVRQDRLWERLAHVFVAARRAVVDRALPLDERQAAVGLLGRSPDFLDEDIKSLGAILVPQNPVALQLAAVERLSEIRMPKVAFVLLQGWQAYGPQLRATVLNSLIKREAWVEQLLAAAESGALPAIELGAAIRQQLCSHPSAQLRGRAMALFQSDLAGGSERDVLIERYASEIQGKVGNPERGRVLFEGQCATCHRLGPIGQGAGPDLASLIDKSNKKLITAILDPNRAVEDKYRNYFADTKSGEQISGILLSETGNSITLMGLTGIEQTLLRTELKNLRSAGLSMMPEGFEQFLSPADMADLLAFIGEASEPPKRFEGNQPGLVQPDHTGRLHLTAAQSEIYGDTLVFEPHYENLGFWGSANDRAVWTVQIPADGEYEVWLNWACAEGTAGNSYVFQVGETQLIGVVPSTGTWDEYERRQIGRVNLMSGQERATFLASGRLSGYLIDLKQIELVPCEME